MNVSSIYSSLNTQNVNFKQKEKRPMCTPVPTPVPATEKIEKSVSDALKNGKLAYITPDGYQIDLSKEIVKGLNKLYTNMYFPPRPTITCNL